MDVFITDIRPNRSALEEFWKQFSKSMLFLTGYPFPGTESHYFIKHEKTQRIKMTRKLSDEEMLKNNGEQGTFIIRVEQRQHSSWQGRVTWVEEGKTENFRSALELLKMIDGALDGRDIKEDAEEENQERAVWRTKNFED